MVKLNLLLVIVSSIIMIFTSLWHSDAIRWYRFGQTSVQAMACCLSAPNHYLNQCWLIIIVILWYLLQGSYTGNHQSLKYVLKSRKQNYHHISQLNTFTCFGIWMTKQGIYHWQWVRYRNVWVMLGYYQSEYFVNYFMYVFSKLI